MKQANKLNELKHVSERQLFLLGENVCFTPHMRWNCAISPVYSRLSIQHKVETFLAKCYFMQVYCLFSLFRLLRKSLDGTWQKWVSRFSHPIPILALSLLFMHTKTHTDPLSRHATLFPTNWVQGQTVSKGRKCL